MSSISGYLAVESSQISSRRPHSAPPRYLTEKVEAITALMDKVKELTTEVVIIRNSHFEVIGNEMAYKQLSLEDFESVEEMIEECKNHPSHQTRRILVALQLALQHQNFGRGDRETKQREEFLSDRLAEALKVGLQELRAELETTMKEKKERGEWTDPFERKTA